jgi:hypothetical protein
VCYLAWDIGNLEAQAEEGNGRQDQGGQEHPGLQVQSRLGTLGCTKELSLAEFSQENLKHIYTNTYILMFMATLLIIA